MITRSPVRQPSLVDQAFRILSERIAKKAYPPGSLLPSETELAEELGVSRGTVRSACARLAERGLIISRQGSGTYVAKLPGIANPLDQFMDFEQRIADHGHKPGFVQLSAEIRAAEPAVAKLLQLEPGALILQLGKAWTADGQPIIFTENHIPLWVFEDSFSREQVLQDGCTEPFFEFFHRCGHFVRYLTSVIRPATVGTCALPAVFSIHDPHTPILIVEDVGYDQEERRIFHSVEHLAGIASQFELLRLVDR